MSIDPKVIEKFWSYVRKEDECWVWTGPKVKGGNGGRLVVGSTEYQARRVAYEIHFGPTTSGKGIRLTCSQVLCVQPEHLLHGDAVLFWSKVNKDGPIVRPDLGKCWIWIPESKNTQGYGMCRIVTGEQLAHRTAWKLDRGPLEKGECVLHHCDNPPCVRPDHLFLGDVPDNNADRQAKGRGIKGRRVHTAKLSDEIVREIRKMGDISWSEVVRLAKKYEVSIVCMWQVVTYRSWKHVSLMHH